MSTEFTLTLGYGQGSEVVVVRSFGAPITADGGRAVYLHHLDDARGNRPTACDALSPPEARAIAAALIAAADDVDPGGAG